MKDCVVTETNHAEELINGADNIVTGDEGASVKLVAVAKETPMPDGSQVYELVWQTPPPTIISAQALPVVEHTPEVSQTCVTSQRKREKRRPYSPENIVLKKSVKKKVTKKPKKSVTVEETGKEKTFSCEKCNSPYVVNPARSHANTHKQRAPRRLFDPSTQKIMLLCNACGLTARRNAKNPQKTKQMGTCDLTEEKQSYLEEAERFAASLASEIHDEDACRLYCPVFRTKPCSCLQNHITSAGPEEISSRSMSLINLMKSARQLIKQKYPDVEENSVTTQDTTVNDENKKNEFPPHSDLSKPFSTKRGLCNRRSKAYESFVLKHRLQLKNELQLCERACQRILLYSNNFIHRQLKTSPNQNARVKRKLGRNAKGLLHPISDLASMSCCSDGCVMLAHTHPRLLESWRSEAASGQRCARRALAEMLTPSGGTKANCYKFIWLVTGCSYRTICQVNEQMRRTKGDREPPEHGLKRWWREKRGTKSNTAENSQKALHSEDNSLSILQQERQKVEELTQQLQRTQERLQQLEHKTQMQTEPFMQPHQQIVHVMEIPSSQVLATSETTSVQILNVSGEIETLTNIGVSLPMLGNVIVLPDTTALHQECIPAATFGSQLVAAADSTATLQPCEPTQSNFLEL